MKSALLTANSGVQYIRLPNAITADKARQYRTRFEVDPRLHSHAPAPEGDDAGCDQEENSAVCMVCRSVEEILDGKAHLRQSRAWLNEDLLPVPMTGGRLWCAVGIKPSETEGHYDVLLAVDTDLALDDCDDGVDPNSLNTDLGIFPDSHEFWSHPLNEQLYEASLCNLPEKEPRNPGVAEAEHYTLMRFLAELQQGKEQTIPRIKIAQPVLQAQCRSVDLVVDLGNSRTCAVLLESGPSGPANQWKLHLCPAESPFDIDEMPCPTELAFLDRAPFPFARGSSARAELTTFQVISPITFGSPARLAMMASEGELSRRGMSSPKRYIWDAKPREGKPWIEARVRLEEAASIDSPVLAHINKFKPWDKVAEQVGPSVPDHPRCTGIILVFLELLSQAYREANSIEYRKRYGDEVIRRRISNVVVMVPASMSSEEVERFKRLVTRALEIWRDARADPSAFKDGRRPDRPRENRDPHRPQLECPCDEAMAIQACYVYSECGRSYSKRAQRMVQQLGRDRVSEAGRMSRSLRLASIDIGGGTIDVSVAEFTPASSEIHGAEGEFHMKQLFRDGYNSAGDDLLKHLLEVVVFAGMRESLRIGLQQWNDALSHQSTDAETVEARHRLVDWLWRPLCFQILNHFEVEAPGEFRVTLGDVVSRAKLSISGIEALGKLLKLDESRLRNCEIVVDEKQLQKVVIDCWGDTLRLASTVIGEWRCDMLLVGGRFSTFPILKELLVAYAPLAPDRIRHLGELPVDMWYPFGINGRVGDAKTAAVVGCGLLHKARSAQLDILVTETERFEPAEQFIGIMIPEAHRHAIEADLFEGQPRGDTEEQSSAAIQSAGMMRWIGVRRVKSSRAPARVIYRFGRTEALDRAVTRFPPPQTGRVTFRIVRAGARVGDSQLPAHSSDRVRPEIELVDGELFYRTGPDRAPQPWANSPPLEVRLQSMLDDTYWLDEGRFAPFEDREDD